MAKQRFSISGETKWKLIAGGVLILLFVQGYFAFRYAFEASSCLTKQALAGLKLNSEDEPELAEKLKVAQQAHEACKQELAALKPDGAEVVLAKADAATAAANVKPFVETDTKAVEDAAAPSKPTLEDGVVVTCIEDAPIVLEPIAGLPGKCLRAGRGSVMKWAMKQFKHTSDPNTKQNALSGLVPLLTADERSDADAKDRAAKAAEARATSYWTPISCSKERGTAEDKVHVTCSHDWLYFGAAPSVKRTQECDFVPGDSCGECEDSSDCQGLFCGCPGSRCVWGQCTGCPGQRMCDEPEYNLTPVAKQKNTATLSVPLTYEDGLGTPYWVFKPTSVYRKVITRGPNREEREDGMKAHERIEEFDSGAYFTGNLLWAGYVLESGEVSAVWKSTDWTGKSPAGFSPELTLTCNAKWCAACAGEKCKVPAPRKP